jgi:hypothetical protein
MSNSGGYVTFTYPGTPGNYDVLLFSYKVAFGKTHYLIPVKIAIGLVIYALHA